MSSLETDRRNVGPPHRDESCEPESYVGKRERLKCEHRQAILDAAVHVLGSGICDSVAVDRIAAYAGLAKGTVYNYFEDKAALVEAVTQSVETQAIEHIEKATRGLRTAPSRVAAALGAMLETAILRPDHAMILERWLRSDRGEESRLAGVLMEVLKDGKFARLQDAAALSAALTLLLSATCAAMRALTSKRARADEARALIAHCLTALGVESAQSTLEASAALLRLQGARGFS